MTGYALDLQGRQLTYFPAGEVLDDAEQRSVDYDTLDDAALRDHPRARRVLSALVRPMPKIFQSLHWSDGRDLAALDELVTAGHAREHDFESALLTEAQTIVCQACLAQVRLLVVDAGQVLFYRTLVERLRDHVLISACPYCSKRWTLLAVEVIE